ncbi:unnamed protein product, partial [Urochloa humidicola]
SIFAPSDPCFESCLRVRFGCCTQLIGMEPHRLPVGGEAAAVRLEGGDGEEAALGDLQGLPGVRRGGDAGRPRSSV